MGQYYDASIEATIKSEPEATGRLRGFMTERTARLGTDFGAGRRFPGKTLQDLHLRDLLTLIYSSDNKDMGLSTEKDGDLTKISLQSPLYGTYRWSDVMLDAFRALAPVMTDGSFLDLLEDEGDRLLLTVNGGNATLQKLDKQEDCND